MKNQLSRIFENYLMCFENFFSVHRIYLLIKEVFNDLKTLNLELSNVWDFKCRMIEDLNFQLSNDRILERSSI